MRTTLIIDDDVLLAAKEIAEQRNQTLGQLVSALARSALAPPVPATFRNGMTLLPMRRSGAIVTLAIVNGLRDGGV